MKEIWVIVLSIYSAIALLGCAETLGKNKGMNAPASLEAKANLKFADIPVPAGFSLVGNESYSFESTGVRVAVLKYQGKADIEQVVNFYREQMPMYNWHMLNITEYGEYVLNFDRESETCILNLSAKGGLVTISFNLGPKSQAPKRAGKPVK